MTQLNYNSSANQSVKGKLVQREVIQCVSVLVNELTKQAECFPDYEDDLYSIYQAEPDYEEAACENGWKKYNNDNPAFACPTDDNTFFNEEMDETSDADSWEELCDEQGIDADDYRSDVYEHYVVTDWFARKLEEVGEKVVYDFFGFTVWCRTATGQAILLDYAISQIAENMGILEGQENHANWTD